MRLLLIAMMLVGSLVSGVSGDSAVPKNGLPIGWSEGLLSYRFDNPDLGYGDVLTLRSGVKQIGKVMEWADQVLLYQADGCPVVFKAAEVERIEFRRMARHKTAPNLPDLTVAYVERLPRDPGWRGHVVRRDGLEFTDIDLPEAQWHPREGDPSTFRIHVLNAGRAAAESVPCRVMIDGAQLVMATVPPLEAGQEFAVEVNWPWKAGRHQLRVEINPEGRMAEISRWNNIFTEPTDALEVAVIVARDRYTAFRNAANLADSWGFEDWVQYHIRCLNALLAASVYPSTPQGVTERLRCDRIVVVDDPEDAPRRLEWWGGLCRDGKPDGVAEYAAIWVLGRLQPDEVILYDALKVDWASVRHIARELGLVDLWRMDTTFSQCLVRDQYGRYLERRHWFPSRQTLMYTAGAFTLDEPSAAFLNHVQGRPRGYTGDFLYQLPEKIALDVRANNGRPLSGVQIDTFQLMAEGALAGSITGAGRNDPLASITTGENGRVQLPDMPAPQHATPKGYALRPNPFGKIAPDGSNALLLLRFRHEGREEVYFLRLYDALVAYLQGQKTEWVCRIDTRFPAAGAPASPTHAAVKMEDRTDKLPPMYVRWPWPLGVEEKNVEEFRIYRRTGLAGEDARPWQYLTSIGGGGGKWNLRYDGTYFEDLLRDLPYSLDTFYAVTAVDPQGRESGLSQPGFIPNGLNSIKLTMDTEAAYIAVTGDGACRMLRWDGVAGTQPYGLRTQRFPGYVPSSWGLVMGQDGRLIVADPANHVLAFYDNGDLVEVIPNRPWWPGFSSDHPGEFYTPADVAVDDAGNIIVADSANNRVQVLDSRGQFIGLVDEEFPFQRPHAVAFSNGHLCVTDQAGTRCRIYGVSGREIKLVGELPRLAEADRALVSKSGKIYITGRDPKQGTTGVLIYRLEGNKVVYERTDTEGLMGRFYRPRGLYLYRGPAGGDEFAYFVNEFPFDVGRDKME